MRAPALVLAAASSLILAACGTESVDVPSGDSSAEAGAEIFASNCAGCHTMTPAGSQGSGNRALRAQGPNFDQRYETYDEVLFAIRNGGFSGAIMPQNIVVGDEAALVSEFVAKYSGTKAEDSPRPSATPGTETGEDTAAPDDIDGEGGQTEGNGGAGGSAGGGGGAGGRSGGSGPDDG